jgi:tRNA threonylcarbamoyladenosine modification (KEOPS) complex  Pcc1 subunit
VISLDLRVEYGDPEAARTVYLALEPDNAGYVESSIDGRSLGFRISAVDAGSLRNSADDLLACLRIAEDASGLFAGAAADLDGDALPE